MPEQLCYLWERLQGWNSLKVKGLKVELLYSTSVQFFFDDSGECLHKDPKTEIDTKGGTDFFIALAYNNF